MLETAPGVFFGTSVRTLFNDVLNFVLSPALHLHRAYIRLYLQLPGVGDSARHLFHPGVAFAIHPGLLRQRGNGSGQCRQYHNCRELIDSFQR